MSQPKTGFTRAIVLLIAGILILLASVLHGIVNVPHLQEDLRELEVRSTLQLAIPLGLAFGAAAGVAFAAVVLVAAAQGFRGRTSSRAALLTVAATYVLCGLCAVVVAGHNVHLFGYLVIGLLVAVGVLLRSGAGPQSSPP